MLGVKSGKVEISGSTAVYTVQYLGSFSIEPRAASSTSTLSASSEAGAISAAPPFHTEQAVRTLWAECQSGQRSLRKAYIAVSTEGIKMHLCKAKLAAPEENLFTPLARLPYLCVEVAVDSRLFAWIEHLDQNRNSFLCHAVAFPRQELSERMLQLALHFMSVSYCHLHWTRVRQLRQTEQKIPRSSIGTTGKNPAVQ